MSTNEAVTPIANARMYSVTPSVRDDWNALLRVVLARAVLGWEVIDYAAPAPLNALWARDDLGLAMMCGLPFSQRGQQPTLIAAPIPSPARYGGKPVYFTDIVVKADSAFQSLEDTFGGTVGYTLADSMSGGVALRDHLAPYAKARNGQRLYRGAVGNLIHARGVIDALVAGKIDVGPLDSYYFDLLKRNDAAYASQVRVIASTAARQIPPLIATAPLSVDTVERLRKGLTAALNHPSLNGVADRLQLAGFATPDPRDYAVLARIAAQPVPAFEEL